ncbi:dCTP deaminase [Streptomyces sviceus]|uniref:dCTP deaminase n=1 Tax=Streptomyces sviceus TaxID=285530 RepID=UPI003D9F28A1
MILTGKAIAEAVADGDIVIDPFDTERINPNSYNYRLGEEIYQVHADSDGDGFRQELLEPKENRVLLRKRQLYLGHTLEQIGSGRYVTSLIGRSSIGRLGLFVQLSADLGHQGAVHRWTLELLPALDIYVYPGQIIGQVSFWDTQGSPAPYIGWYGRHDRPMPSKLHQVPSAMREIQ